jgi:hypothetical protein
MPIVWSLPADQLDGDPGLWEFLSQEQVRLVTLAREHQLADRRTRVQVRLISWNMEQHSFGSVDRSLRKQRYPKQKKDIRIF